jgi:DNA-directed RNA polymerase I subunit RPA1
MRKPIMILDCEQFGDLQVYGVEVCRATILSEVQAVFGAYGISVNPRHLGLIADFMTFQGGYRPCNRMGINSSPSPFLKMSFETATTFLMDATLQKQTDHLESPSARIVMGRIVEMGTGSFDLLQNIDQMIESAA